MTGSRLGEAADKLRGRYVEGLPAKWWVIEEAVEAWQAGERADAERTLRRLAHQVRGAAASFGFSAIDAAATKLEHAGGEAELQAAAEQLIVELRRAYWSEPHATVQILLIDDDPYIGLFMRALLSEEKVEVTQVTTAAAALRELESAQWSVIFVDLVLPDADGRTLLTKIRSFPMHRDTPLLVLSAKTGSLARNECHMYGIDGFIDKPIDAATFPVVIASVLERSRSLLSAAYDDSLTGLPNRVGFRRGFEPLRIAAARQAQPLALALLDIDHFKRFNDTYGHHVGDETLRVVARTLAQALPDALLGRWGGEEFIVALANTDALAALGQLERAAGVLREQELGEGIEVRLTFSSGVTQFEPGESLDLALLRADQLLYQAKRSGRARVAHTFEASGDGRPTLLIAEDDPDIAALLLRDLSDDYDITHAADGNAALVAARKTTFDIVLLDYQMPRRNGAEVVRALRQLEKYRDKPILLLTVVGNDEAVEAAFAAGADDYISKPHSRRALLARLARHLGRAPRKPAAPAPATIASHPTTETEVTALFCDISAYTELSSRMAPSEVVAMLNEYFPTIVEIVTRHGGTLEKFIGDALLAVWAAPKQQPRDDAERALRAAIEIQAAVEQKAASSARPIRVHIGINSGMVAVGAIGTGQYMQYATIGSTTNMASRVCNLAAPGEIAISGASVELLGDRSEWGLVGPELREVKGGERALEIHRVLGPGA